ncbi:hypothetical protein [Pectinatus frisingensis]|nr:hypothetical protein [Pectinatus frisingensis]
MVKYIYEFKKCIVQEYLNGKGGYGSLAKANDMSGSGPVKC